MHNGTESIANGESPAAQGGVHDIYRLVASLLFALDSFIFLARSLGDRKSQSLVLNGCILGFFLMFVTVETMTVTQFGSLIIGTTVFAVLTELCPYKRVTQL